MASTSTASSAPEVPATAGGWRQPLLTVAAMAATLLLVSLFAPARGPLVLGAALAFSLSRSRLAASRHGRLEALLLLPLVALLTTGVGLLLKTLPAAGAAAYVAAMFLSVWLRRYGPLGARIGGMLALPFITLLVVPGGGGTGPLAAMLIALAALLVVLALRLAAEAAGLLPRDAQPPHLQPPARPSSLRPIASTRMAIQFALALGGAFAWAWLAFPEHLTWVVLAALLVFSGNRGRADVLHKSGLRIAGVAAGTLLAAAAGALAPAAQAWLRGAPLALLLLAAIGLGLWLRQWSYAAWACVITLVVSLLQSAAAVPDGGGVQIWARLLATLAGAACSVAAAWWVLPVRSEPVLRLRIAEVLAALGDWLAERTPEHDQRVRAALVRLEEVSPPWDAWERIAGGRRGKPGPGQWLRLLRECARLARARDVGGGAARRALGEARRALREPEKLGPALRVLRDALTEP